MDLIEVFGHFLSVDVVDILMSLKSNYPFFLKVLNSLSYTGYFRVHFHWKHALAKKLSVWNWVPHFYFWMAMMNYLLCTMYGSCPLSTYSIDRLWCGFILCLTCILEPSLFFIPQDSLNPFRSKQQLKHNKGTSNRSDLKLY